MDLTLILIEVIKYCQKCLRVIEFKIVFQMVIFSAIYLHSLHQPFPLFSFPLSSSALLSRYVSFLFSLSFLASFLSSPSSYFPFVLSTFNASIPHQQRTHVNFVQPLLNGRSKIRYTVLCTKALSFKLHSRIAVCLSSLS